MIRFRSLSRSISSIFLIATAEALYVHPNTLRQRLRRIMELTGLDLRKDDWLMVEIAVKLVQLQHAADRVALDTSRPTGL